MDGAEFLRPGRALGEVVIRYRMGGGPWQQASLSASSDVRRTESTDGVHAPKRETVYAGPSRNPGGLPSLRLAEVFESAGEGLEWTIRLQNTGAEAIEIGDLELPLPMNTDYAWDHEETFRRRVFKHAFVSGHGSFLYWLPVKGSGSFLVLIPRDETGLEFFTTSNTDYAYGREEYSVFVHSRAKAEREQRGTWRQPRTRRLLPPAGDAAYRFTFCWADGYEGVRELLYQRGGVDVHVAPGMVIPRDLAARFALRMKHAVERIEPEFPGDTVLKTIGQGGRDTHVYQVQFRRLGENLLTVRYGQGRTMVLEFFVTEPLETLFKKRASFIARNQQHRDPAKWYDGLYSLWDRRPPAGHNLLGPDNLGDQPRYAVSGSDDPSNSKCLLLAEKNCAYPDAGEIASLEYFVEHFVWGKHQRTDREQPFPYGIYGGDDWRENRFSDRDPLSGGVSRPGGPSQCRMWRTFDYTTYFALYFDLYRIAKCRPDLVKYLDAGGYLDRAYGTARAYFEVPQNIRMEGGWSFTGWVYWQYTIGNFHEKYLLPLIAALEAEGQRIRADWLRGEWEKKVKYFIYDQPWPFASEMPIDSTAYESTYAAADYALTHVLNPDTRLWHDRNLDRWYSHSAMSERAHQDFLMRQHQANLACRGALEANYWSLGSDFRGCGSANYTLSYMSQMGGWAVLDYALRYDPAPAENLRLGYASLLSSWALVNSGDAQSSFGFWTPGPLHDGAASWGFQPRQVGTEWNPATRDLPRGAWPVDGEVDHGLAAAIEAARTVLFDDPLLGLFAYGGEATQEGRLIVLIPRDGRRQRFSAVLRAGRLHVELDRDGLAAEKPLLLDPDLTSLEAWIENRGGSDHLTEIRCEGLPEGKYTLQGARETELQVKANGKASFHVSMSPGLAAHLSIRNVAK